MTKPSFFTIFISKNLWLEVGKWLFGYLPERVQSTAWCQKLRIDQTKILTPRSALYSLRKVLKLPFPQNKKKSQNSRNSRTGSRKSVIWVPSGTITEHCLVPKVAPCLDEDFGTKQCSVIVPEGTEIAISAKSKNRKNAEKSWTGSRKSVICVPIATSTEHCLVPKVAPWPDEDFGTKQCSVIVPEGTEIAISAKWKNRKIAKNLWLEVENR